jgi:phospho-N-acetylmuramoyl-pentapeptide-transferase
MAMIGFVDDIMKIRRRKGLGTIPKFVAQLAVGLAVGLYLYYEPLVPEFATKTSILFFKNLFPDLRLFYIPFVAFVLVGTSNAVNLTDGLDGLATGLMGIAASAYFVLSYVTGHVKISEYLNILFMNGAGELSVFCTSMLGACLGFLWFNAYPARVFLGDVGSLALGGALGIVAILIKQEMLLLIVCGFFVIEVLSVILQVLFFKLTKGKRLFLMSPIHHHYELKGWSEPTIVVRFWIVGLLFALLAISTLKIR